MAFEHFVIGALLVYSGFREWTFWRQSQKLIDKLMSKNYYDYEYSRTMSAPPQSEAPQKVTEEVLPESDVGAIMSGIM